MSPCLKCADYKASLKNEVVVEVLKIFSAVISTDEPIFDQEVEKFNIGEDLVDALKSIRDLHNRTRHPVNLDAYDPVADENAIKIQDQQLEIERLFKRQNDTISSYNRAKEQFESNLKYLQLENHYLREDNTCMKQEIGSLHAKNDKQEQYSRRHILEVKGVPYQKGENTTETVIDIFRSMGLHISHRDICRSHRNGRRGKGPRPIYVKFVRHDVKDQVFAQREVLRDIYCYRRVYIDENLTNFRRELYSQVRKEKDFDHWTYDGAIYVSRIGVQNARVFKIVSHNDYEMVFHKPFPLRTPL